MKRKVLVGGLMVLLMALMFTSCPDGSGSKKNGESEKKVIAEQYRGVYEYVEYNGILHELELTEKRIINDYYYFEGNKRRDSIQWTYLDLYTGPSNFDPEYTYLWYDDGNGTIYQVGHFEDGGKFHLYKEQSSPNTAFLYIKK